MARDARVGFCACAAGRRRASASAYQLLSIGAPGRRSIVAMSDGERAGLEAALQARLAAAGLEVPDGDAGGLERDLALHLERLAELAAAADLGPADPPLPSPAQAVPSTVRRRRTCA